MTTASSDEYFRGVIDLHMLPPVPEINGARIHQLTGDVAFSSETAIILRAFRAVAGVRTFLGGFCIGDGERFSPIGIGVIERLRLEAPNSKIHVVPIVHEDVAFDIVLRRLRSFTRDIVLFAFSNSDVYDAGATGTLCHSSLRNFYSDGKLMQQLSAEQRRQIRMRKAEILNRPPPPVLYAAAGVEQEDSPWIFRVVTPKGKEVRTAVWNGRRNYEHEFPEDIIRWVGGDKIAIVQVHSLVGVNLRSSLQLTMRLSKDHDGIIHWARDTETFQSIIKSFVRLDLETVSPPELPENWNPSITMMGANPQSDPP
ncbi:MAG: hypothetical protein K8F90_10545 [Hyphomicrobiales bacterium]|nr:hypothetical protein [Hyphomicrobiales bacterium]